MSRLWFGSCFKFNQPVFRSQVCPAVLCVSFVKLKRGKRNPVHHGPVLRRLPPVFVWAFLASPAVSPATTIRKKRQCPQCQMGEGGGGLHKAGKKAFNPLPTI